MKIGTLLVVALTAIAVAAPSALAGSYTVHSCSTPDGRPASLTGWAPSTTQGSDARVVASCERPGGHVSLQHPPGSYAHAEGAKEIFTAPLGTTLESIAVARSFSGSANVEMAYQAFVEGIGDFDSCVGIRGCQALPLAERRFEGRGRTQFQLWQFCATGLESRCANVPALVETRLYRATIVLSESAPPVLDGAPVGALLQAGAAVAGTQTATVPLRDVGGGLKDVTLEVDGQPVLTQAVDSCVEPYTEPVPCKLAASVGLSFDTTRAQDGRHRIRLVARDVAGNIAAHGPVDVDVRNAPASCGPGAAAGLQARFGARRRRTITVPYGAAVRVTGRGPAGAGVQIRQVRRIALRGEQELAVGRPAQTDAKGRFSLQIARGPSRTLRVGYRAGPNATALTCSAPLRLRVRAPVTLRGRHLPARRQRAAISGRVGGGFMPRRGVRVTVQALEGGRWQTFGSGRTDRRGRFRVRLPFSGRRGTFRLRAVVPSDPAFPFALGRSRAVRVRVG